MAEIQISFKLPADRKIRVGYKKKGTNYPFTYLSHYLSWNDSPYTISSLEEGSYVVELTTATASCLNNPCGTPQLIEATAADPNTIYTNISIGVDAANNVFFSADFSEIITSSVTISGSYVISGQTKTYSVIIPEGVNAYNQIIDTTYFTQVDNYCYSSIHPSIINNKTISIQNTPTC